MYNLAQTVWPRFGGDQANRSQSALLGPHTTPTWQKISLPSSRSVRSPGMVAIGGVIVMPDGTWRVCHAGMLSAITSDGTILWQLDLSCLIPDDSRRVYSLPTALQTGETLIGLSDSLLIVDRQGHIQSRENRLDPHDSEDSQDTIGAPDDSGYSPNLTYSGVPILTGIAGEVYLLQKNLWHELGVYGYDIVPPAVYPDNSLAIAGYGNSGFCRVNLNGERQWTTKLKYADKLPTLNHEYIAAVGSDDGYSAFFSSDGEQIGAYKYSARFAEYIDGGWIALSKKHQRLARLTTDGREVWSCEIAPGDHFSFVEQPIVDSGGFIFVRQREGYLCCDAHGHKAFAVKLPTPPQGLMSIIAPGTMAYVVEDDLFIGHS